MTLAAGKPEQQPMRKEEGGGAHLAGPGSEGTQEGTGGNPGEEVRSSEETLGSQEVPPPAWGRPPVSLLS